MIKYDKCPCSKTSMLVFEPGQLSRKNMTGTIFASVNYLSKKTYHVSHLQYQEKLVKQKVVKEILLVCTVDNFSLTRGFVRENLLL